MFNGEGKGFCLCLLAYASSLHYLILCMKFLRIDSILQAYASRGVLTDVDLVCEGVTIAAHRVLLAAASDYFAAMFTGTMAEASMPSVEIQGVEPAALKLLVDYCYSGIRLEKVTSLPKHL